MTRKAVETGALWKPWKNGDIKQTTLGVEFFHRSHRFYDEIHPPKNETPRLQKCNLCAREKLLPMNRELHLDTRSPRHQHDLYQCSLKVPRLSLVFTT